jgi:hypothetical protein
LKPSSICVGGLTIDEPIPKTLCTASVNPHLIQLSAINSDIDPAKDWPLIIADFLITDRWIPGLPPDLQEKCERELKHFLIKDQSLVLIMPDGTSTTPYIHHSARLSASIQSRYVHCNLSLFHLSVGKLISSKIYLKHNLVTFISFCN